ncbi:acyl-CoA reductase [Pedobacter sp. SYSU D00535]|uniref:acyl-CoA reductase n=1 Tax=Pedobacter sp. SYSU D00535 TaxID=2810308 RepID=UPI001A9771F5|nr:acyl-CoA reductase [Pedobacter sp. SYSU D00535]
MTSILTLQKRKEAFLKLGEYLLSPDELLLQLIQTAQHQNGWFTKEETTRAVKAWGNSLNATDLNTWLDFEPKEEKSKRVGLILAGNIPLVGFHDILSVLASGHIALIKLSSQDNKLTPYLLKKLIEIEPGFEDRILFTERLEKFDAVIATGSNNSSRYFEYYFSKVPHIIRKNRNSVAVLTGDETPEELFRLGHDIFDYYGLGCRNVSKLFVPVAYNFNKFFEAIESYKFVINNHKYANNYDYNKSVYLVNSVKHLDNGFLLLKGDQGLSSPLSVLFYEEYEDLNEVEVVLQTSADQIQCVACSPQININSQKVGFGETQQPKLWDYADNINTIAFLQGL